MSLQEKDGKEAGGRTSWVAQGRLAAVYKFTYKVAPPVTLVGFETL